MSIPNWLTLLRVLLIPAIVAVFYLPWRWGHGVAAGIFVVAAITDLIDGYLARNLNQETRFGAFLDPVADKLVVAVALLLVVSEVGRFYLTIPAAVIIGREITISALREWMAELGKRASVAVGYIAKVKTALQMVAVSMLLLYYPQDVAGTKYLIYGIVLLYLAAGMTLWSMYLYLKAAWPDLTKSRHH